MLELSNLTLVIPSYNRQRYALRSLKYWSGKGVRVHLLDGTEHSIDASSLEGLEGNVSYHHVPCSFYDRLKMGPDLIKTEYAALLSDDEFFLPSAIQACIEELEGDSSLVACTGRTLAFKVERGQVVGHPFYEIMENYAVLSDDPIERIIYHMDTYACSTIYSVVRASVWKSALSVMVEKHWAVYAIGELQFEISVSLHGKSKVIPHVMWLRSFEQEPIRGNEPSLMPANTFCKWWCNEANNNEHNEFLSRMARKLEQDTQVEFQNIYNGIRRSLDLYAKNNEVINVNLPKRWFGDFRNKAIRALAALIPAKIKKIIRPFWTITKPLHQAGRSLVGSGCYLNDNELLEIEGLVAQFYSEKAPYT